MNKIFKRFYYFDLRNTAYNDSQIIDILFICRNCIVFDFDSNPQTDLQKGILFDIGKEVPVDDVFLYVQKTFNPLSICWLDESELERCIDFAMIFSDFNINTKGNFLQDYITRLRGHDLL